MQNIFTPLRLTMLVIAALLLSAAYTQAGVASNVEDLGYAIRFTPDVIPNLTPENQFGHFGDAVAIDDNLIVIGDNQGNVYVFELIDGNWAQTGKVFEEGKKLGGAGIGFETPWLDIDGDRIISGGIGGGYLIERDGSGSWEITERLIPSLASSEEPIISAVVEDHIIILGAPLGELNNFEGIAYVFEQDSNGNWLEVNALTDGEADIDNNFGYSVAQDDGRIIVGDPIDGQQARPFLQPGAVHIFEQDINGQWMQVEKLTVGGEDYNGLFGVSVALDNDTLFVGARTEPPAGAVYVFERDTVGNWVQEHKLLSESDTGAFGFSLSVDGATASITGDFTYSVTTLFNQIGGDWQRTERIDLRTAYLTDVDGPNILVSNINEQVNGIDFVGAVYLYQREIKPLNVLSIAPSSNTPADPNTNLVFTADQELQKGTGGDVVITLADGIEVERVDVSSDRVIVEGATVTIDPASLLIYGMEYKVVIEPGAFTDLEGNPFSGIAGD